MSTAPNITINIDTKANLSGVDEAKGAVDGLSDSLKDQPGIKIDKADTSGVDKAREAIDDLKGSSPIEIALQVNTDAINQAKAAVNSLNQPVSRDSGLDELWNSAIASAENYGQTAKKAASEAQSALNLDDLWGKSMQSSEDLDASIIKLTSNDLSQFNQSLGTGNGMMVGMTGQVGKLTAKIGKIAAGAAIFAGVYSAGKMCWQALFDYVNRYEIKAKEAVTRTTKAAVDGAKEMWNANKSAYAAIEQSSIKQSYDQENKIVESILQNYKDAVDLVNNMAAAKQREIAADLKILDANKEKEKSIIRQKVLSGEMTKDQGDRAALKVDTKTNDERRALERKVDEEEVNAAKQRVKAAEKAVKELEDRYRRMSRQEATAKTAVGYQKDWLEAAPAISGSATNKRLIAQRKAAQKEIDSQNQIKRQNKGDGLDESINREAAEATIVAKRQEIRAINAQIEEAKSKAKEISKYNDQTPIDQTGKTAEEIRDEVAGFLGDFDGYMKGLREQLRGVRGELKSAKTNQDNTQDTLQENDRVRGKQKSAEKEQTNEQAAGINKSAADRSLARLKEASDKASQDILTFADNVSNSSSKIYAYLRRDGSKSAEATQLAQSLAKNGSSEAQLVKLSKLLKEAKSETPYDGAKNMLELNIGEFVKKQWGLLKETRANTGGAEVIKQTRDQFVDNARGVRSNPDYQKKPDSKVEDYIRQTQHALDDNKLSKAEAGKIRAMAAELAKMVGNQAAQEASLALQDSLSGMLTGQKKLKNQAVKRNESTRPPAGDVDQGYDKKVQIALNSKKLERAYADTRRNINSKIDDINDPLSMRRANTPVWDQSTGSKLKGMMGGNGTVDGAEINELRAMLAEYQSEQGKNDNKSVYSEVINVIKSMIALGNRQDTDISSFRSQLQSLSSQVDTMKSQSYNTRK